jgi:pre-mRNA-splicing factor SYF1
MIVENPTKITSLNVDAIIRSGIRRYPHEVGRLWSSLAEYYTRLSLWEKARDVYEEGINSVSTVRDFSLVFDAYSQYLEGLIGVSMELVDQEAQRYVMLKQYSSLLLHSFTFGC